jgi:hypothetical protein
MFDSMLFNLGLTADAASAHRHEFSSQPEDRRSRVSRALSALSTIPITTPFSLSRSPSPLKSLDESMSHGKEPSLSTKSSNLSSHYSSSDNEDDNNDDISAVAPPPRVSVTVPKRAPRSKTIFQLAHPPGNRRHRRLRLRPKLLLQLQMIGPASRPVPTLDVLPATGSPLLAFKFPKLFGVLHKLGPRDLIIVTSDSYEQRNWMDDDRSVSSDDYSQDQREIVATISQSKNDTVRKYKMEMYLDSGVSWEGTPMPNGSYEFVSRGQQETRKVRWVLRKGRNRSGETSKRFTFSVIDPNTRRHPVMASMTQSSIDVYDQYSIPSVSPSEEIMSHVPAAETGQELINMENDLRMLILVTGTWIAFMEGWSKNFSYGETAPSSTSPVEAVSPKRRSCGLSRQGKELEGFSVCAPSRHE